MKLFIEVKGARARDNSPNKKRKHFNSGQIKTHFGTAIVKVLNGKYNDPTSKFAITHPEDIKIRKSIGHLIFALRLLGIGSFWVYKDGNVIGDWLLKDD